jgi:hypothetical protein
MNPLADCGLPRFFPVSGETASRLAPPERRDAHGVRFYGRYLDTAEDEAFGREVLDMGERTCFLHALCRTQLATHVQVITRPASVSPSANPV